MISSIAGEPTVRDFEALMEQVRGTTLDAVIGIGGGSVLDAAKLVAVLHGQAPTARDCLGIDRLPPRRCHLACLPTTAGTGSEVSPNSILLDETDDLKKGLISPWLVPDAAYVDPELMLSVPPAVTAFTGIDALVHCIEAYANRFAHPIVDLHALEGVRLISGSLRQAVQHGGDLEARSRVALGSLYGGLCLGPVNTAAVHALAYPLGGEFKIAHGLSNALLLPHVLRFNLPAAPARYAAIARALGVETGADDAETAARGVDELTRLCADCGIPRSLGDLNVPRSAIPRMADAAMTVQRLLKNNVREVTADDARRIYEEAA